MRGFKWFDNWFLELMIVLLICLVPGVEQALKDVTWIGYLIGAAITAKNTLSFLVEENDLRNRK